MSLVAVLVGAAVGAPVRWLVDRAVRTRSSVTFPWGTVTVNVTGSLLLGGLLAWAAGSASGSAQLYVALVGTGFCGALTTFSTFAYETVVLAEEGSPLRAISNVLVSVSAGLAAAAVGWWLVAAVV